MRQVYLDNSSTTKVLDEVAKTVFDVMTLYYGNPSSLHRMGIEAEKIMNESRKSVAKALGVTSNEIYFTSGGTESNNLAVKGVVKSLSKRGNHLITTTIEHPSVLEAIATLEREGYEVTYLKTDKEGLINVNELKNALNPKTLLVSIIYANNEVGSIQPIKKIGETIKKYSEGIFFHVDGIQAFGKLPLVPNLNNIDALSLSCHKIYGPKGIGALFLRDKTKIRPLFQGGGQEKGLRSGTENLPGIAGLGKAVEICFKNLSNWIEQMARLKHRLMKGIFENIPDVVLNGPKNGAAHLLNISFLGTRGEILLHALESNGIYVSTGSACSSKGTSRVLRALGKTHAEQDSAIRFSLSPFITLEDIDYTIEVLIKEVNEIRKIIRR